MCAHAYEIRKWLPMQWTAAMVVLWIAFLTRVNLKLKDAEHLLWQFSHNPCWLQKSHTKSIKSGVNLILWRCWASPVTVFHHPCWLIYRTFNTKITYQVYQVSAGKIAMSSSIPKAVETKQLRPRLAGEWFGGLVTVYQHVAIKYTKLWAGRHTVDAVKMDRKEVYK